MATQTGVRTLHGETLGALTEKRLPQMAVAAKRPQPPAGSRTSSPQTAAAMLATNSPHEEPLALPPGALAAAAVPHATAAAARGSLLPLGVAPLVSGLSFLGPAAPLPLFKPLPLPAGCAILGAASAAATPLLAAVAAAAVAPPAAASLPSSVPGSPHARSSQTGSFAAAPGSPNMHPMTDDGHSAPPPPAAAAALPPAAPPLGPATPDLPAGSSAAADGAAAAAAPTDDDGRAWLYSLVTCPWLFKPCPTCCRTHTGRESLMTYFSPAHPTAPCGLCGFCPGRAAASAASPGLLQIRRSTYHEVVKISDLGRLADVAGIQHYVINGAKVVFLRPRPQPRPPKGVAAPSRCEVDGRQLMDGAARFCSLQCKLEGEDGAYACRYALATAHAATAAATLSADLSAAAAAAGSGPGAAAAAAAAAVAADIAASGGEQPHHAGSGASGRGAPVVIGAKRAAGLLRFEGAEESGDEEGATGDDAHPSSGSGTRSVTPPPLAGARGGKKPRAASAGVALAAAAARGTQLHAHDSHSHAHHHHHVAAPRRSPPPHAVPSLPAADAAAAASGPAAASAQHAPASPASSHDSGRSSTCRWHAKRRKGEPVRAPLQ